MFFVLLIVEYGFAYMHAISRPHACFRATVCERYAVMYTLVHICFDHSLELYELRCF